MKRIILLIAIFSSFTALAQTPRTYRIEGIAQRFSTALGIPVKASSFFNTSSDTAIVFIDPSDTTTIHFKYKGVAKKLAASNIPWDSITAKPSNFTTTYALSNDVQDSVQNRVPYENATRSVNLGNYRLNARGLLMDSLWARSSGGSVAVTNSGTKSFSWGAGGSSEVTFYGFAGMDFNRSGSMTSTSFTPKVYVDSSDALRVRYTDTAAMLAPFVQYSDTANMLSPYRRTSTLIQQSEVSGLSTSLAAKLNISDTATMLSPYRRTSTKITNSDLVNSTISGIALGSNLNNLSAGNGLSGTAYNGSAAQTWQVDTSTISTKANVTGALVGYVTVSGTQTITGAKTFNSTLNGQSIISNNSGAFINKYTSDAASRSWRMVNDLSVAGTLSIDQELTKDGGSWASALSFNSSRAALFNNTVTATQFIRSGGTSSQFLKADGSVDGTAYGTGTVTSVSAGTGMSFTTITSSGAVNADTTTLATRAYVVGLDVGKANTSLNNVNGVLSSTYGGAGSVSGILKANGSGVVSAVVAGDITSLISGTYLPLSGGTLTGTLNGLTINGRSLRNNGTGTFGFNSAGNGEMQIYATADGGMIMAGRGSANDITLVNRSGSDVIQIPTGTTNVNIVGALNGTSLSMSGNINATATIYANGNITEPSGYQLNATAMGYSSTGGYGWLTAGGAASRTTLVLNAGGGDVLIGTLVPDGTNKLIVNGGVKGTKGNFTGSTGETMLVTGATGEWSQRITASSSTNNSFGLIVNGGTSTSDISFKVTSQSGGTDYLVTRGDGLTTARKMVVSGGSGELLTVNGVTGENAARITGSSSTSNSFGLLIAAGTNASDAALTVTNQDLSTTLFRVRGDGAITASSSVTAVGIVSTDNSFRINGNGATPSASSLAIGTNGVGTRLLYNVPTGGEHNLNVNGVTAFYATSSGIGTSGTLAAAGAATFSSSVTVGGALSFSPSSSKIVSGITDFAIRNNADNTSMLHFNNSTLAATFTGSVYGIGFRYAYAAKSSNYTLTDNDDYINVTSSCTITLPTAVGRSGKRYVIKCTGSAVATIASTSSQTIDGNAASTYTFGGPNFNIMIVYSDGSNWFLEAWQTGI